MQALQAKLTLWANKAWDAFLKLVFAVSARIPLLTDALQRLIARIPLTGFQWMALAFIVFGCIYAFSTPIFEAGEELEHFTVIHTMKNGGLPVTSARTPFTWGDQVHQPPLYYATAALLTLPIDTSDFLTHLDFNPYANPEDLYGLGNRNLLLPDATPPAIQQTTLAVIVLRLLNVATSVLTLWAVTRIATFINPRRPAVAIVAVALTAFNPMFLFLSSSVGNLPLAMALNSVLVLILMQFLREGMTVARLVLLAVLLALAILTHLSALVLLVVVVLTVLALARQTTEWRTALIGLGLVAVAFLVVDGWWFVRNVQLYGDPLNLGIWQQAAGLRPAPLTADRLPLEFAVFRQTYWGVFGIENIRMADVLYILLDLFVFTAILGVIYLMGQLLAIRDFAHARRELAGILLLQAIVLVALIGYFVWLAMVQDVPGTHLFPVIAAISPLLAAGFIEIVWWMLFLITPPDRSYVRAGDAVPNETLHPNSVWTARVLGVVALLVPFIAIVPAYSAPAPVEALGSTVQQVYARYGNVELVGYDMLQERYLPGQMVGVTLFWRVIEPTEDDYSVTLALLPPTGFDLGKVRTFPGWGKLRTSTWQAGATYADTYFLRLDPLVAGNFPLRLHVIWNNDRTGETIAVTDEQGNVIPNVLLDAGAMIYARAFNGRLAVPDNVEPRLREFGQFMRLEEFAFDRATYHTILVWNTMKPMEENYTVSVQILDSENSIVRQQDVQPSLPTRFWQYGDRYFTDHALVQDSALPPGDYRVIVAVYDLDTLERLEVGFNVESETPEPIDYTQLFTFSITQDAQFVSPELDELQPEVTPEATAEASPEATVAP